jgi:FtsZ-binding cell division protein ZapB
MGNTARSVFQTLADEFEEKSELIEELEEEVKSLPHTTLSIDVNQLMERNCQLTCEVSHLQASIDELCEEVVPLQEDNN